MERIYLTRPLVGEEELSAVREVLDSKYLTEGPRAKEFESKVATYLGVRHAVATTSCTKAMELALGSMGVGPGDEVIVADFTYPATAQAVLSMGATPILVDVLRDGMVIDPVEVKKVITKRTKCVMPVSNLGYPVDIDELRDTMDGRDIGIVEDAACALGTVYKSRKVGSSADVACFSFHPRKLVTTGEGGMLVTSDDGLAGRARVIKAFGATKSESGRQTFGSFGTNLHMADVLASIGAVQMGRLEWLIEERAKRARVYDDLLSRIDKIDLPPKFEGVRYNQYCYATYVKIEGVRNEIIDRLRSQGIEAQIGSYALHMQPAFSSLKRGRIEHSRLLYENLLQLPLHHELTEADQHRVAEAYLGLLKEMSR